MEARSCCNQGMCFGVVSRKTPHRTHPHMHAHTHRNWVQEPKRSSQCGTHPWSVCLRKLKAAKRAVCSIQPCLPASVREGEPSFGKHYLANPGEVHMGHPTFVSFHSLTLLHPCLLPSLLLTLPLKCPVTSAELKMFPYISNNIFLSKICPYHFN